MFTSFECCQNQFILSGSWRKYLRLGFYPWKNTDPSGSDSGSARSTLLLWEIPYYGNKLTCIYFNDWSCVRPGFVDKSPISIFSIWIGKLEISWKPSSLDRQNNWTLSIVTKILSNCTINKCNGFRIYMSTEQCFGSGSVGISFILDLRIRITLYKKPGKNNIWQILHYFFTINILNNNMIYLHKSTIKLYVNKIS